MIITNKQIKHELCDNCGLKPGQITVNRGRGINSGHIRVLTSYSVPIDKSLEVYDYLHANRIRLGLGASVRADGYYPKIYVCNCIGSQLLIMPRRLHDPKNLDWRTCGF